MTDATSTPARPHVAVLGTGTMGSGVASTLLREGFPVTVWNRSAARAEPLAAAGATVAATPGEAVASADVVLSILFDADAVRSVLAEAVSSVPTSALWVQCSTVGVEGTAALVDQAATAGVDLVEAMMLGTKAPAEKGALVMLFAGPEEALTRIRPVLDAMGQKTVDAGRTVGDATKLKLAANAWIATITAGTAQSLALAEGLGLDPRLFLEAIAGGQSDSVYAHVKGEKMLTNDLSPAFALDGLLKDVRLAEAAGSSAGVRTELLAALASTYAHSSELGHGGDDIAAVRYSF